MKEKDENKMTNFQTIRRYSFITPTNSNSGNYNSNSGNNQLTKSHGSANINLKQNMNINSSISSSIFTRKGYSSKEVKTVSKISDIHFNNGSMISSPTIFKSANQMPLKEYYSLSNQKTNQGFMPAYGNLKPKKILKK